MLLWLGEAGHLLGTDDGGRDIMKLLMMGGRNSIMIGISVTVITEIVGLVVGLVSGYYGGVIDVIIMRIVDLHSNFATNANYHCFDYSYS